MVLFDPKIVALCSLCAVVAVVDSDDQNVKEYTVNYSCCNPLPIVPKEHCEQKWSFEEETIAYIHGSHKNCIAPCQKDGDKLKICDCVDCTAHNVCKNGTFASEERIHYKAQPCQQSQSNQTRPQSQGHVGLLLVALFFRNY